MRGALKQFEGIEIVGLQPNVKTFAIKHDRNKVSAETLAAAISATGEAVTVK